MPLISLRHVGKKYQSGESTFEALKDINLDIEAGEFVAIVGASGSGKSTLLHLLGFLDSATQGIYQFSGQTVTHYSDSQLAYLRNQVAGFVFQQFHLLPGITAENNVYLPLLYSSSRHHLNRAAQQRLKDVGLGHRMNHIPNMLSGGERQRVGIARALINNPQILFADEPTGNLDTRSESDIMAILKGLNQQGMTIVMVTHEKEIAEQAQRVITMRDGEIISDIQQTPKSATSVTSKNLKLLAPASIPFFTYCQQAFQSLMIKKLRTVLSLLGILIGVAAVITMLAIGSGARQAITSELSHLGANRLIVRPGPSRSGSVMSSSSPTKFLLEDSGYLHKVRSVKYVSAIVSGRCQTAVNNKNWITDIYGVEPNYAPMHDSIPKLGRMFTSQELQVRARVAIIGKTVATELFGHQDPLGQTLKIDRIPFTVIGIFPEKGDQGGKDYDDLVVMPITTAMHRLFGVETVNSFELDIDNASHVEQSKKALQDFFYKKYQEPLSNKDFLRIRDMSAVRQSVEGTVKAVSLLLGIVSAISLLVGGIGIMNIMLVSVTERTREIGLRKALGATQRDIMIQFLIEAIVLTGLGGLLGIAVGVSVSFLVGWLTQWSIAISFFSILVATGFSLGIGLLFGLLPAKQAAQLNTVDALRYE